MIEADRHIKGAFPTACANTRGPAGDDAGKAGPRHPSTVQSLLVFGSVLVVLIVGLRLGAGMHLPLFLALAVSCIGTRLLGNPWERIQAALFKGVVDGLPAASILLLIGMLVGLWIAGGTIPTLLSCGLSWLTPRFLVPTSCLLSCVASVATGTSFGTISTVGLALMGVGEAMGVPGPLLAGAIVSGAYFGDKMSPLSDTTNVAPAVSGSNIYEHIAAMAYTTLPALAISLAGFFFLGTGYSAHAAPVPTGAPRSALLGAFNTGFLTLVPIVFLAVFSIKKVPPVPALAGVLAISFATAIFTQRSSPSSLARAMVAGYVSKSGDPVVDKLLTRGGMNSMLPTVFLILMATGMGGVLRDFGVIERLVQAVLLAVRSSRGLILSVAASCYLTLLATGNQMLALILPGQAFREAFARRGVPAKILSRTLEDFGTLGAPLVPWSTAALFINDMLRIPAVQYAPYALLNWTSPLVATIYTLTGTFTGESSFPRRPNRNGN
ncbi:MAG TPA: Na+/H+ antiporter NhaC [Firmicutes bacterium]|nr:Na+/H+ antiporter NhaC [Candidatus Fermentithermobacillaceae bacterium]